MGGLLHLVQRGGAWAGCGPAQSPARCTKCNSPPINSQCTNFILFDVAIYTVFQKNQAPSLYICQSYYQNIKGLLQVFVVVVVASIYLLVSIGPNVL